MGTMASLITSLTIVYSTVYSAVDQRKHQSSASMAFVRVIHRWPHKWPVTRKCFSLMTSSWIFFKTITEWEDIVLHESGPLLKCISSYTCLIFMQRHIKEFIHVIGVEKVCSHGSQHVSVEVFFADFRSPFRKGQSENDRLNRQQRLRVNAAIRVLQISLKYTVHWVNMRYIFYSSMWDDCCGKVSKFTSWIFVQQFVWTKN